MILMCSADRLLVLYQGIHANTRWKKEPQVMALHSVGCTIFISLAHHEQCPCGHSKAVSRLRLYPKLSIGSLVFSQASEQLL
jgi:hypothetical protein